MTETSHAVFLSYASQDAEAAQKICHALRAAGIEVWFDQSELRGGDAWDHSIRKQIKTCALFIPVISHTTHDRREGYFRLEWKLAVDRSHLMDAEMAFLLPVVIDDTRDGDERVPERFRDVQWTRMPGGATSPAFVERISRLLWPEQFQQPSRTHSLVGAASGSTSGSMTGTLSSHATRRAKSVALLIALAFVFMGGYMVLDKWVLSKRAALTVSAPVVQTAAPAPSGIAEKSIAVLPFVDMSEKKDQEYFSDGLSEELIDLLTKVADLRVPARTSSFFFKGKSEDVATIAQKLRVAHVLEGSVRKAGNRLRVTAQLIRADNGYHLWSETYDRELKDVFQVQDEIAAAVVTALKLKLAALQPTAPRYTPNVEAYSAFLLGTQFLRRGDVEGYRRAGEALRKAIALDPKYAEAYSLLAYVEWETAGWVGDAAALAPAKAMADKAVELAPEQVYGYASRAFVRLQSWDWAGAQADYQKALTIDPNYGAAQLGYAILLGSLGRLPEAIVAARKSVELDPLSTESWGALQDFLISNRDYAGAEESIRQALDVAPDSIDALSYHGLLLLLEGKASEALVVYRKLNYEPLRLQGIALAEHTLGSAKESQQALDELIAKYEQFSYWIALVYGWRGEKDKAFEKLELAYQRRISGLEDIKIAPLLNSLRADPRYKALLHKMNLPE